jgi:hypothetical protein
MRPPPPPPSWLLVPRWRQDSIRTVRHLIKHNPLSSHTMEESRLEIFTLLGVLRRRPAAVRTVQFQAGTKRRWSHLLRRGRCCIVGECFILFQQFNSFKQAVARRTTVVSLPRTTRFPNCVLYLVFFFDTWVINSFKFLVDCKSRIGQ